jgi:hypothetical protein
MPTEPELCSICKKREAMPKLQYCAECKERYLNIDKEELS